jgi:uncharacterized protein YktB (UPF0637 family)
MFILLENVSTLIKLFDLPVSPISKEKISWSKKELKPSKVQNNESSMNKLSSTTPRFVAVKKLSLGSAILLLQKTMIQLALSIFVVKSG